MYTVAELIETLKQCPQDYPVYLRTETGVYNADGIYRIYTVGIDPNEETVDIFAE